VPTKEKPTPSCVLNEGGVGWSECVDRIPLHLAIRMREGTEGVDAATRQRDVSLFVVSVLL